VRFRDEQTRAATAEAAIRNTGESIGGALGLAAITTAIGFLAFAPTAYRGVSELGLIAGAGMLIALALNLTLLPALLRYLAPKPLPEPPHLFKTPAADRWVRRNRRVILAVTALLALSAAALLPRLAFDFNPLNLKDPNSDSVRTLNKLTAAGLASPHAMQLLVPNRERIGEITTRLKALPEIGRVMSIESFVPKDQDEKLQIIRDAGFLLGPALYAGGHVAPPTPEETRESVRDTVKRLHLLQASTATPPSFGTLADVLQTLLDGDPARLAAMEAPLTAALKERLASLPLLFQAAPITFESLPDSLKRQWIAPDGRYRIEIRPGLDPKGGDVTLSRFVAAVHSVAPDAMGGAYAIQKSGEVVWTAFKQAFLYALIGVVAVLGLVLRRAVDVALIVGPLLLSALLTLAVSVLIGLPINFANVIALPLLMGIGVAFNIYFVTNWRRGQSRPLRSSTARAVVFSALTTLSAVASLALSPHRGTASMGQLLSLCLALTLLCALLVLPALLARGRRMN
jgi:hopanoid biosynthesis associated RND transporter like protein HpnN